MANSSDIVATLKRVLRSHGITYSRVAKELNQSEANVKRMFAKNRFTLDRIDEICRIMNMDVLDLLHELEHSQHRKSYLTNEQEKELVADNKLLLTAICVRSHYQFEDIISNYSISETECIQHLAKLDQLGLIDLLPNNHIKLRIAEDFRWLPNGAIERFFRRHILSEFLQTNYSGDDRIQHFIHGELSSASHAVLMRKLESVIDEFSVLQRNDSSLAIQERIKIGLHLAMRPYELSAFQELRKNK